MEKIRIDLNGCELDTAQLTGFMAVSQETPNDFKGAEVKDGELTLLFDTLPEPGAFREVLRVLGGSAKGDEPMTVISPEKYRKATAVPHESRGARRWPCPRCAVPVMQGHNDTAGALFGVCSRCHAIDTGNEPPELGDPPPAAASTPSSSTPRPPTLPPAPSSATPVEQADKPPAPAKRVEGFLRVPTIPGIAALPNPPPYDGLFCVIEQGSLLCWSAGGAWHVIEGRVPPRN